MIEALIIYLVGLPIAAYMLGLVAGKAGLMRDCDEAEAFIIFFWPIIFPFFLVFVVFDGRLNVFNWLTGKGYEQGGRWK